MTTKYRKGQPVEFRSVRPGNPWLAGTVAGVSEGSVRIQTGKGVWVVRARRLVRPAVALPLAG